LNPSGTLQWSTYYGGSDEDQGFGISFDPSRNVYLTGYSYSNTNIAYNGFQTQNAGNADGYIVKFTSSGERQWATYYGGQTNDVLRTSEVFGNHVYVAGYTHSATGISFNGYQDQFGGSTDAFFAKFTLGGTRIYGSYYGGSVEEIFVSSALDEKGNLFLAGDSYNYPTLHDALLVKIPLVTNPPKIVSLSTESGPVGSAVVISGSGFGSSPEKNIVYFGACMARVMEGSTTELKVLVPAGATFSLITVTTNGLTAYSTKAFLPTFPNGANLDEFTYSTSIEYATGNNPISVAISDLDQDGKNDLTVANSQGNTVSILKNAIAEELEEINSSSFAPKVDYASGIIPRNTANADIDGDGKLDLIVANQSTNEISIFRNTIDTGAFDANSFSERVDLSLGSSPFGIAVNDLDEDGKPDLVVSNYGDNEISVIKNISTPGNITVNTFLPKIDFATGLHPCDLGVADFDGDQKPDISVVNNDDNSISIFRNIASAGSLTDSSFSERIDLVTAETPIGLALADFNGDGKVDIVTAALNGNVISVFENISLGELSINSFAPKIDFAVGLAPHVVAVSDLNGDAAPDIVVTNSNSASISIFQNISSIENLDRNSFAPRIDLSAGGAVTGLALGDLNSDAKPEIVVTLENIDMVSIFQNVICALNKITVIGADSICFGSYTTLTASGATAYQWTPSVSLSDATGSMVEANPSNSTTYHVIGTFENGCVDTEEITVIVNPVPDISVTPSHAICLGATTLLTAQGGADYTWSPSEGLSDIVGDSVGASPVDSITYTVTGADGNGCTDTEIVAIAVNPLPEVSVTDSHAICKGTSTALVAVGAREYFWQPSEGLSSSNTSSVEAKPAESMTYTVTGSDENGCTDADTISVTLNALPEISLTPSHSICIGTFSVLDAAGATDYSWSPAEGLSAATGASVEASPFDSVTYTVTGTDHNGCSGTGVVTIMVNPLPEISVTASHSICEGTSTVLFANGGIDYSWAPSAALSDTTGNSVNANPSMTTTYKVTGKDGNNCADTAETTISVIVVSKPTIMRHPDSFGTLISSSETGNQWFKNNVLLPGETNQTLVIGSTGDYSVQVTKDSCLSLMSDALLTVISDIKEIQKATRMIYPNPVIAHLEIDWGKFDKNTIIYISITDILGNTIVSKEMHYDDRVLDISTLCSGNFVFRAVQRGVVRFERFLKSK